MENYPTLSTTARKSIIDGQRLVFVSAVSVREISVKQSMGKLDVPNNLIEEIRIHRFTPLEINFEHARLAGQIPSIHKDPFDRNLIAQSIKGKLSITTREQLVFSNQR
ncbi:MAG: type II toxin-antitoxin system VapC family toxin [Nitrospinota bacterium]